MSDIKLFSLSGSGAQERPARAFQLERSLQKIFEDNLETLLGVRFLASEYSTGPVHNGRIDTLGLDEDCCPVIIEYKRAINENVINQGLFYLDWLMDHRKDFEWLALKRLGAEAVSAIDWSSPRLLCIAADYTRYDTHAVKQIARNIELLRYRQFGSDLLMIDLIHTSKQARTTPPAKDRARNLAENEDIASASDTATEPAAQPPGPEVQAYSEQRLANSPQQIRDVFDTLERFILGLGDEIQVKQLKHYTAFKRIRNFACVEIYPQAKVVVLYLRVKPDNMLMEPGFTRDVRLIGHHGTGDLEVCVRDLDDVAKAQPLIALAFEAG